MISFFFHLYLCIFFTFHSQCYIFLYNVGLASFNIIIYVYDVRIIVNTIILTHYSLCFNFSLQKMSIVGLNLIREYIILYAARGVMMYFQSGPQNHLDWPPLIKTFEFSRFAASVWFYLCVFAFHFIQCQEAWIMYWNRSDAKCNFKRSSGKDFGTHDLQQSHIL